MQDKIDNLEIRIAYLEDLLDELNKTVAKLNQENLSHKLLINKIILELKAIKNSSENIFSAKEEIPPHY